MNFSMQQLQLELLLLAVLKMAEISLCLRNSWQAFLLHIHFLSETKYLNKFYLHLVKTENHVLLLFKLTELWYVDGFSSRWPY